jgi:hypothetical protein
MRMSVIVLTMAKETHGKGTTAMYEIDWVGGTILNVETIENAREIAGELPAGASIVRVS